MAQVISSRNNSAFSTFYTWLVLLLFFYTSFSSLPEGIMVFELLQCSSVRRGVANFPCSISQRFSRHLLFPMFSTMLVSISCSIYWAKKVKKKCSKTFFLLDAPPAPPQNIFLHVRNFLTFRCLLAVEGIPWWFLIARKFYHSCRCTDKYTQECKH